MLSTAYRLKLEFICHRISQKAEVPLEDMVFAEKLAKVNTSAAQMLKKARLTARTESSNDGMDCFLRDLIIGGVGNEANGYDYDTVDDIVDFWRQEKPDDWRQRD